MVFVLVSDIEDIPENIKNLRALQVADFSSNPIPRLIIFYFILFHFYFTFIFVTKVCKFQLSGKSIN